MYNYQKWEMIINHSGNRLLVYVGDDHTPLCDQTI